MKNSNFQSLLLLRNSMKKKLKWKITSSNNPVAPSKLQIFRPRTLNIAIKSQNFKAKFRNFNANFLHKSNDWANYSKIVKRNWASSIGKIAESLNLKTKLKISLGLWILWLEEFSKLKRIWLKHNSRYNPFQVWFNS